jgi:very-short-patch-repair endonuclease
VEEIARLVADKNFGERSIGVVSLLGPDQGKLIFDSLLERIGEEAFLKHRVRCGDARTFQGSEADVIFISAVDDAESGAVMTSNKLENIRRINVAVSRARDRLYFFHSFARDDLSELDLRAKLMDHFRAPIKGLSNAQGRELCESRFEREMFDALTDRGFRVIPQVRVGNYRIDFVVEGHQGKRLAVECDGDQYHGPDKWMDDIGRQRVLERAGWKFWRCWGSSFARDKAGCLDDLIRTLMKEGIDPVGRNELDFSGFVEFREIGALDEENLEVENTDYTADEPVEPLSRFAESVSSFDSVLPSFQTVPGIPENELSDPPPRQEKDSLHAERNSSPTISIGDAVRYQISDEAGMREQYIMILNQPSNWKLGIVNCDEAIARYLLGRREGDRFVAHLDGATVRIEITMKHEVST